MPKIQYDAKGFPIYNQEDGWKDYGQFTAAALNDMDRIASKNKATTPLDSSAAKGAAILPAVGGAIGALVPGLGETGLGEVGGTALGSAAKSYLKSKYPDTFGKNPDTNLGQVADTGSDILTGALPGIASGAGKAISSGAKIASSVLGPRLAGVARGISNLGISPAAQKALQVLLKGAGTTEEIKSVPSQ